MKKLLAIVVVLILIVLGVIFVPRLIHVCDDCDTVFVGTGYEPNMVVMAVSDKTEVICKECAKTHHAASLAFGKSLEEFRKDLF